jgi:antitoxin VapB
LAFSIKDRKTQELARKVAASKGLNIAQAIHEALRNELERELEKVDLVERGMAFARALRAQAGAEAGKPADKEFIDSLYEDD